MDLDRSQLMLPTDIEIEFADGVYRFALLLPQQFELEKSCGYTDRDGNQRRKGLVEIYSDVIAGLVVVDGKIFADPHSGRASAHDCREIVRLALIGGGSGTVNGEAVEVSAVKARQLCEAYIDTAPLVDRWTLAGAILRAAVEGFDPPKKAEPAPAPAKTAGKRTKASATPTS